MTHIIHLKLKNIDIKADLWEIMNIIESNNLFHFEIYQTLHEP